MKKKEGQNEDREREREGNRGNTRILEVLLPRPPRTMVEQDWTHSTITLGHLQKLVKQWFLMAAELVACHVLEDPAFPAPEEGNMVSVPRSFDILDLGAGELRLLGYPKAPLLLAS
jgi:hypothetical protein